MISPVILLGREAGEFVVNSVTAATQDNPRVAKLASGGFVVVWTDYSVNAASGTEIKAQVYNPFGVKIGGEISVNASPAGSQTEPVVTGLSSGGFAVAWGDSSAAEWGKIQIFDPFGSKIGGEIGNMPGSGINYPFEIAGLSWGGFVVVRPLGIGQVYDAAGTPVGPGFSVGTGFQGGGMSLVAALSNGNFVVAVAKAGGAAIQLFDQNGAKIGAEIATTSSNINGGFQIGALDSGGFVLAWGSQGSDGNFSEYGARAQIFSATGAPVGGEIALNSTTLGNQVEPSVVGVAGGGFLATWTSTDSSGSTVRGQVFSSTGEKVGREFLVSLATDPSGTYHDQPAVAAIGGDRFALVWHGVGPGDGFETDGSGGGIRGQILQALGPVALDIVPSRTSLSEIAVGNAPAIAFSTASPAINATYSYQLISETTGGGLSLSGDRLFVADNNKLDHEMAPTATLTVRATDNAGNVVEEVIQLGINDAANELRYSGGSEAAVGEPTDFDQHGARIARLPGGGFVVTWTRDSDGDTGFSVMAQIFDSAGSPVAAAFRVNTDDALGQYDPSITVLASGGFAISWTSDGDFPDQMSVRAQIFDSAGAKVGGEIAVNGAAAGVQWQTEIAPLSGGGFVVGWVDTGRTLGDTSGTAVHGQVLDAAGNTVGSEFLINTETFNTQTFLALEGLPGGGFIAAWADLSRTGADTSSFAVKAQLFDSAGAKIGGEILVNTSLLGSQSLPSIAVNGPNMLIVWVHGDGSSGGIRGQLFDGAGNRIGGELVLDSGFGTSPSVEPGPAGGFLVSWMAASPLDGSQTGVFGLLLSSTGEKGGDPFLINQSVAGSQSAPTLVALAGGTLAGVWTDGMSDVTLRLFTASVEQSVAKDDSLQTNENAVLGANLFADNGSGADSGGALEVAAVNGSAAAVGQQITLASGAKLTVGADGSVSYDPNGAFADLADRNSGASNTSRNDSFTYTLRDGTSATATVTVYGVYSAGNTLQGTQNADSIAGSGFSETLNGLGGDDLLDGGPGDDRIDGGAGHDRASYASSAAAVYVTLASPGAEQNTSGAGIDTLVDVEGLIGSVFPDTLIGDGSGNYLDGNAGADILRGAAGDDLYVVDDAGDVVEELAGEGADTVFTSLAAYSLLGTYIENLAATTNAAHDFRGSAGNNAVSGGGGNDLLRLNDGGDDVGSGGAGNDILYFGSAFTGADRADGGEGRDVLILQGNYALTLSATNIAAIESISLQSGARTTWGDTANNFYDYNITMNDLNVGGGEQLIVNGQSLRAGEDFTFDGSAETGDGKYLVYGGHGVDTFTGGAGNDVFFFEGNRFGSNDTVDGGAGRDALIISSGSGVNRFEFGDDALTSIESISLNNRFTSDPTQKPSYEIVLGSGNIAPGATLIVNGSSLSDRSQSVSVDGSAVEGNLILLGGFGDDTLTGGDGADRLQGGEGIDRLTGGGGADTFRYASQYDATPQLPDRILDFVSGTDKIDLSTIDADVFAAGNQAFRWIGAGAFGGTGASSAGELRAYQFGNDWFVEGDIDGNGAADLVIVLSAPIAPIVDGDFLL